MNLNKQRLIDILIGFIFVLVMTLVITKFLALALAAPHSSNDAYAIWNMRARFINRLGVDTVLTGHKLDVAFSPLLPHTDYPPLLPFLVAGGWRLFNTSQPVIPISIALIFTFGTVGILYLALTWLKLPLQARLFPLLLLTTPNFILFGTRQMADIPLAFFILCAVVFLALHEHTQFSEWLALSGASAGLALLTKNEGSLFVLCLAAAALPLWRFPSKVFGFILGILPFVVVLIVFKLSIEASNDIVAGQGQGTLDKLVDLSRYRMVFEAYARQLRWYVIASLIGLAFMASHTRLHLRFNLALRTAALMLIGYFLVYVVTPRPLDWHLQTSLHRLILHIWPVFLFGCGLLGLNPAESAERVTPGDGVARLELPQP
jgi:4-amino-4-deoxy-L-arabinose transferase-like glycosyltransferase